MAWREKLDSGKLELNDRFPYDWKLMGDKYVPSGLVEVMYVRVDGTVRIFNEVYYCEGSLADALAEAMNRFEQEASEQYVAMFYRALSYYGQIHLTTIKNEN